MTKSRLGEERVYLAYISAAPLIAGGSQDRNSNRDGTCRQELIQRPQKSATYWLAPHGLLNLLFFIEPRITSPGVAPPTKSWALSHQSLIKKMPCGLPTAQSYEGIFSIEGFSLLMILA